MLHIFLFNITCVISKLHRHTQYDTHLSLDGLCSRIIKYIPLSVLSSFLFFILRLLFFVLTALWRFIGAVDDPRESLLRAPVNYPGVVIRRAPQAVPLKYWRSPKADREACTASH